MRKALLFGAAIFILGCKGMTNNYYGACLTNESNLSNTNQPSVATPLNDQYAGPTQPNEGFSLEGGCMPDVTVIVNGFMDTLPLMQVSTSETDGKQVPSMCQYSNGSGHFYTYIIPH